MIRERGPEGARRWSVKVNTEIIFRTYNVPNLSSPLLNSGMLSVKVPSACRSSPVCGERSRQPITPRNVSRSGLTNCADPSSSGPCNVKVFTVPSSNGPNNLLNASKVKLISIQLSALPYTYIWKMEDPTRKQHPININRDIQHRPLSDS